MTTAGVRFRWIAVVPLVAAAMLVLTSCAPRSVATDPDSEIPVRLLTPAAPPPGSFIFEIPLPDSLVQSVAALKSEFVGGVVSEVAGVAEGRSVAEVEALIDVGTGMRDTGRRVDSGIASIGEIDMTFGIPGASQLVPLSGAVRDTLFGYVIWHESADSEGPRIARELERLAGDFRSKGELVALVADSVDASMSAAREALEQGDLESSAAGFRDALELSGHLDSLSVSIDDSAVLLVSIIDEVMAGGAVPEGSELMAGWERVLSDVAELRALSSSLKEVRGYVAVTGRVLAHTMHNAAAVAGGVTTMVECEPGVAGGRLLPWNVIRDDMTGVKGLKFEVLPDRVPGLDAAAKRAIESRLALVVEADRLLAERAVAVAEASAERARSDIEEYYRGRQGTETGADRRELEAARDRIAAAIGQNLFLQSALSGVRQARAFLEDGREKERMGVCHEGDAIRQYKDAWLHALNAGANANRALEDLDLR